MQKFLTSFQQHYDVIAVVYEKKYPVGDIHHICGKHVIAVFMHCTLVFGKTPRRGVFGLYVCTCQQNNFNQYPDKTYCLCLSSRNYSWCCPYLAFNGCLCFFAIFSKTCTMNKYFFHCTCFIEYYKTT